MFPATLFDYNGVLANDETVHLAAFQDALQPLGISLTEADYWQKYLGFDDVGAFGAILMDAGRPLDAELLLEAIRFADFSLNHLAVGDDLARGWSLVEEQ